MLAILFIHWAINGLAQFSHMTHVPCELGKKKHLCSYLRFLIVTPKTCQGESLLVCLHQFAFYVSVSLKWPQESDHHWGFSSLFFSQKIQDINALISSKSAFCELIYYTSIKKCSQRLKDLPFFMSMQNSYKNL